MREQRANARVNTPLTIDMENGQGVVRDLSASGIYFITDVPLKAGQALKFTLAFREAGASGLSATCQARIVRVEKQGNLRGVAASINHITFYAPIPRSTK